MDEHTQNVVAGLLMNLFRDAEWKFEELTPMEKLIVGNQTELNILLKFCTEHFDKDL